MARNRLFEMRFEPIHTGSGWLHIIAENRFLTDYMYHGRLLAGYCGIDDVSRWMRMHLPDILRDDPFPAEAAGAHAAEMWFAAGGYLPGTLPPDDCDPALPAWLDRHALCTCNPLCCLPFTVFRSTAEGVEISWQNTPCRFPEAEFLYPSGCITVTKAYFETAAVCFLEECDTLLHPRYF